MIKMSMPMLCQTGYLAWKVVVGNDYQLDENHERNRISNTMLPAVLTQLFSTRKTSQ